MSDNEAKPMGRNELRDHKDTQLLCAILEHIGLPKGRQGWTEVSTLLPDDTSAEAARQRMIRLHKKLEEEQLMDPIARGREVETKKPATKKAATTKKKSSSSAKKVTKTVNAKVERDEEDNSDNASSSPSSLRAKSTKSRSSTPPPAPSSSGEDDPKKLKSPGKMTRSKTAAATARLSTEPNEGDHEDAEGEDQSDLEESKPKMKVVKEKKTVETS